jgi:hypothetical protein
MGTKRLPTPFLLGAALFAAGSAWAAAAFSDNEKTSSSADVEARGTTTLELDFGGAGTGFYVVTIADYSNDVVVYAKVTGPAGNLVSAESITTKTSVNYFEAGQPGRYTLAATNSSNERRTVQAELGNAGMEELIAPFLAGSAGLVLLSFSAYARMKRRSNSYSYSYRTSQPEDSSL